MPTSQSNSYEAVVNDKRLKHALAGKQTDLFKYIGTLQKLCSHPALLGEGAGSVGAIVVPKQRLDEAQSAKMLVLYRLMREMRRRGDGERIVVFVGVTGKRFWGESSR